MANQLLLNQIKRAIRRNLDELASQLINAHHPYLSRRAEISLAKFMIKQNQFPCDVIKHLCYRSVYVESNRSYILRLPNIRKMCYADPRYAPTIRLIITDPVVKGLLKGPGAICSILRHPPQKMSSCAYGVFSIMKILLDYASYADGAISSIHRTLLYDSLHRGDTQLARYILTDLAFDFTAERNGVLIAAIRNGCTDIAELLLADTRTDPNYDFYTILYSACYYGDLRIVRLLLEDKRVDMEKVWLMHTKIRKSTYRDANSLADSLHIASVKGHCEIVNLLLHDERVLFFSPDALWPKYKYGRAQVTAFVRDAFCAACGAGQVEVVKLYLKIGIIDPIVDRIILADAIKSICGSQSFAGMRYLIEVLQILIADPRVDLSNVSDYVIQFARNNFKTEIAKMLEDAKLSREKLEIIESCVFS